MASFIISGDPEYFDVDRCLRENNFVEWKHRIIFAEGDIIYLYLSGKEQKVKYKLAVSKVNIPEEDLFDDSLYVLDEEKRSQDKQQGHNYRFDLVCKINTELLNYTNLEKNNIKGLRGMKLDGDKLQYVEDCFLCADYDEIETLVFTEGGKTRIYVNNYERNPRARQKCLDIKGYKCAVCGMDFESVYGKIGRGFIHVHHLVPNSTHDEKYEIDCVDGLVPVCPNCHAMLHRGENGRILSIDELKKRMKK